MALTLNNVIARLEVFCDNHHILERFTYGDIEDVDTVEGIYPLMHVVPVRSSHDGAGKFKVYQLEILFADRPTGSEDKVGHQKEVFSDMEQCAEDLINDIQNGGGVFSFDELWAWDSTDVEYFNEDLKNTLSGCMLTIGLKVPYTFDACSLPITGYTPTSSECADATVQSTAGYYSTTVASGGTLVVANNNIRNSDNSWNTSIEATQNLTLSDFPIKATDGSANTTTLVDVPYDPDTGYTFAKIGVKQQDATIQGYGRIAKTICITNADITSVSEDASNINIAVDVPTQSGIAYMNGIFSQTTSYRTGDEAWQLANNVWDRTPPSYPSVIQSLDYSDADPFNTLLYDNAFGNKSRFTDEAGTAAVSGSNTSSGLVIDHLTGYMWYAPAVTGSNWDSAIDACVASSQSSYTDWYLPSRDALKAILPAEAYSSPTPGFIAADMRLLTSTTMGSNTTYCMVYYYTSGETVGYYAPKTNTTYRYVMVRKHY